MKKQLSPRYLTWVNEWGEKERSKIISIFEENGDLAFSVERSNKTLKYFVIKDLISSYKKSLKQCEDQATFFSNHPDGKFITPENEIQEVAAHLLRSIYLSGPFKERKPPVLGEYLDLIRGRIKMIKSCLIELESFQEHHKAKLLPLWHINDVTVKQRIIVPTKTFAARACLAILKTKGPKAKCIQICTEYFQIHTVKGFPDYTPKELAHVVAYLKSCEID